MKKIDYYASQTPWKMPKWLGATLGGIFGVIAIGSGLLIIQLTHTDKPAPIAAVAAAPIAAPAPAVAAPAAPVAPAPVAAPATASADESAQAADTKHHSKHHASRSSKKAARLASAKKAKTAPVVSSGTILAKHDTKDKRHEKDQLDKLLGL
ncbi:MAG TPA: hypothetical protein VIA18_20645 [Polyangia bacterium]|nr:hypothetical protein [Polyangia bacterium]